MNWKFAGQAFFAGSSRSFRFKSSDSRSSSPLTGSESVAFSTCSNASLLGSRYEDGRDVLSSVMRFFESPTLRSRSSDFRRSLLLVGSDSVAFSTCSKASSLGSRSGIIAICTDSDGLHRIIYADWLKKSPHTVQSKGQTDPRSSPIPNRRANTFDSIRNCFYRVISNGRLS
jgi:hypothetical protein